MDPVQVTVHIGSQTLACPPPPDPPSLCACAITAIASSDTSLGLPDCNILIFNTLATANKTLADAIIIFFFIIINLRISNLPAILPAFTFFQCHPALQGHWEKEDALSPTCHLNTYLCHITSFLFKVWRESEEEAVACELGGFLFF